jgi:hypothetical protein
MNETGQVVFTIRTTNVPDGTTLYWDNGGNVAASDLSSGRASGTITVANGLATLTLTAIEDELTEGVETLQLRIRTQSMIGDIVRTSSQVSITDSSILPASIAQIRFLRPANNQADAYFVKYKVDGSLIWGVSASAPTRCQILGLARAPSGGVYSLLYYEDATFAANNATSNVNGTGATTFATLSPAAATSAPDGAVIRYASSGTIEWIAKIGGLYGNVRYGDIASDASGNVYILISNGENTTTTFRNSDDTLFVSRPAENASYIAKYNSAGFVQWVRRINGINNPGYIVGWHITADISGNVYTGFWQGSPTTIYAADYTTTAASITNPSNSTSAIVKYNSNGMYQWHVSLTNNNNILGLKTDSAGYVYYSGEQYYGGVSTVRDSSNNTLFQTTNGRRGSIIKFDPITAQVLSYMSTSVGPYGISMAIDNSNNVYALTRNSQERFFNSDGQTSVVAPGTPGPTGSLCRYDASGNAQWAITLGYCDSDLDKVYLDTDASQNVYVHGSFVRASNFQYKDITGVGKSFARGVDAFATVTSKVTSAGVVDFVRRHASGSCNVPHFVFGMGLAVSDRNNVYAASMMRPSNASWQQYTSDIIAGGSNPVLSNV